MKKKKWLLISVLAVIIVGLVFVFLSGREQTLSPYEKLVNDGYGGTPEQLLASLVGELITSDGEAETAFDRASLLRYAASYETWIETLTNSKSGDQTQAVYRIAEKSGYQNGLVAWLESLVPHPEELGNQVTEYTLACENGFEGSFIQWLISLIGYQED